MSRSAPSSPAPPHSAAVVIRPAYPDDARDARAPRRASTPAGPSPRPLLVAERDGRHPRGARRPTDRHARSPTPSPRPPTWSPSSACTPPTRQRSPRAPGHPPARRGERPPASRARARVDHRRAPDARQRRSYPQSVPSSGDAGVGGARRHLPDLGLDLPGDPADGRDRPAGARRRRALRARGRRDARVPAADAAERSAVAARAARLVRWSSARCWPRAATGSSRSPSGTSRPGSPRC